SATGTGLPPLSGEGPLLNAGATQAGSGAGLAKTLLLGAGVSSIGAAAIWATVQWSSPTPVAPSLPIASDAVVDRPTADVQATEPHAPPQTDESARPLPSEEPLDESPLELDALPA